MYPYINIVHEYADNISFLIKLSTVKYHKCI